MGIDNFIQTAMNSVLKNPILSIFAEDEVESVDYGGGWIIKKKKKYLL